MKSKVLQAASLMSRLLILFSVFFLSSAFQKEDPRTRAVYKLIERMTPGYSKQFVLELIKPEKELDVYEISGKAGRIILRGNNSIALSTAYNQYLKYTCDAHFSWFGDQINLPKTLPAPEKNIKNNINGKYRVYMNYCTVSYSAAWWDWERWERELDYMAMNSINMPLSVVGLETVWYNTLLKYGFSDLEARTFLAGPGHFAWQWMQNLQSYGGPLPMSWIVTVETRNEHAKHGCIFLKVPTKKEPMVQKEVRLLPHVPH